MRLFPFTRYHAPDTGVDGGTPPPSAQPETPPTDGDQGKPPEKQFTQAEVDQLIKDRLERAKRQAEKDKEASEKAAREKALQEQGEFKTLAEQRATELADAKAQLEAAKSHEKTAERYKTALEKTLAVQKAALPELLRDLLPADPADAIEWIAANQDKIKALATPAQPQTGTPKRDGKAQAPQIQLPERKWTL